MGAAQAQSQTAPDTVRRAVLLARARTRDDSRFPDRVKVARDEIAAAETLSPENAALAAVFDAAGEPRPPELSPAASKRAVVGEVTRLYTGLIKDHGAAASARVDRRTSLVTSLEGLTGDDARVAAVYDVAHSPRPAYLAARPSTGEQREGIENLRHRLRLEGASPAALGAEVPETSLAAMDEWARLRGLAEVLRIDPGDTGPPPRKLSGMFTGDDGKSLYLIDHDGQVRTRRADAKLPAPWNPLDGIHALDTSSLERVTAGEVGRLGRKAGRCIVCNAPLRSEASRQRGMGEHCASRVS